MSSLKKIMDEYKVPEYIQRTFKSYVKEWLEQHKKEILSKYAKTFRHNEGCRINHCNELLEELE